MGKIAGIMLTVYIIFKIIDTIGWINGILPAAGMTYDQMFYGIIYGQWLLHTEIIICGVLPVFMLLIPGLRNNPFIFYTAAILVCTGVTINRYVMTVQPLAIPVMPFDIWDKYNPNWAEWGAMFLVVGYAWIVLALSYRYLPMFPQEKELNPYTGPTRKKA
jgi:molybdopterin-containing oxidoreductase family membrane subunit